MKSDEVTGRGKSITIRNKQTGDLLKAGMPLNELSIVQAVDNSVVETVEAFVRFRPGFHGDTGVRDYLYHRLMTNLPDCGTYRQTDSWGTLLAQAEWYTALKYRKTGKSSSRGRFDL